MHSIQNKPWVMSYHIKNRNDSPTEMDLLLLKGWNGYLYNPKDLQEIKGQN